MVVTGDNGDFNKIVPYGGRSMAMPRCHESSLLVVELSELGSQLRDLKFLAGVNIGWFLAIKVVVVKNPWDQVCVYGQ